MKSQAIVDYVEFGLVSMIQDLEPNMDPDVANALYKRAHEVLVDLEQTLKVQDQIDTSSQLTSPQ